MIVVGEVESFQPSEESPVLIGCSKVTVGTWRASRVASIRHKHGTDSWVFTGAEGVVTANGMFVPKSPSEVIMFAGGVEFKVTLRVPQAKPQAAAAKTGAVFPEFVGGVIGKLFHRK